MKIDLDIEGAAEVKKNLEKLALKFPDAVGAALYEEGLEVQRLSVLRTPVDTGRLRASAYTAPPVNDGGPVVKVAYGTDYSLYVHERTEAHHETGQSKFLESAANERASGFAERVAKSARKHAEGGTSFAAQKQAREDRANDKAANRARSALGLGK